MNKRILGKTGIEVSELGYGCAALFGKSILGKQGLTEERAFEIVSTALENGIFFFDTGFNYGYAEERLGRCLRSLINNGEIKREEVIIETKCGETINSDGSYGSYDWSSDWIKESVEISLKRLNLDYIDLLAMHGGTPEDCSDELLKTFEDLKAQGIIRAYGVNTFNDSFLNWIHKEQCFDYVMLDYSVINQRREEIINKLCETGIGVIAGMALGQSLFKKRPIKNRNDLWYYIRAITHFRENMKKSKQFEFLTEYPEYTGNQLALRYVLDNESIASAVFSTISLDHLIEDIEATNIVMPQDIRIQIKERG